MSTFLKLQEAKKSHHCVDLYKPILKMYIVLGFEIVFHKIIEENCKHFVSK